MWRTPKTKVRRLREGMRVSIIATVVLVLLGVVVGYYLGAQQRHVESDAYGFATMKLAFSNQYDCEVLAVDAKDANGRCVPLTFAQVHAAGFRLVPREMPRDSGGNSND
jgi:hypothetical protein